MKRLNISEGLTLLYSESKTGGLYGFIEEVRGIVYKGETLDELVENIINAKRSTDYVNDL